MNEKNTELQNRLQRGSTWLTQQLQKLSIRQLKVTCITVGIIAGGFCLHLIFNSSSQGIWKNSAGQQIIRPSVTQSDLMSVDEYQALQQIKHTLDSLRTSDEGKILFEKLRQEHPGFLDSLEFLLSIYQRN